MSSNEVEIANALASITPAQAAGSTAIREIFQRFFAKGTPAQCLELFPKSHRPSRHTPIPNNGKARNKTSKNSGLEAVVNALTTAKELSIADYETLWNSKHPLFQSRVLDPFQRIRRLIEGITKIETDCSLSACALRLSLLFFLHELDRVAAAVPEEELKVGSGVKRMTIAIDKITNKCGLSRQQVTEMVKRTKTYLLMAQSLCVGYLLVMGTELSRWEKLTIEQVSCVGKYCRKNLPSVETRSKSLNVVASHAIIRGLQAYGYSDFELSEGGSRLMDIISKHVDLKRLTTDQGVALSTPLDSVPGNYQSQKRRRISLSNQYDTLEGGTRKKQRQELNAAAFAMGPTPFPEQTSSLPLLDLMTPSDNEGSQWDESCASPPISSPSQQIRITRSRNRTSQTQADSPPLLAASTHDFRTVPNTTEDCLSDVPRDAGLMSTTTISAAPVADNRSIFFRNGNDFQGFIPNYSRGLHSPSLPRALLVPETLFYNVKVYFQNCCQSMNFDDDGTLLDPDGAEFRNDLCNNFDSFCFTATMLHERRMYADFPCALSNACALVEQILRAEHPRTLVCFLEVFIHLVQTGHRGVTLYLLQFIKEMSAKVNRKGHPWGQIWRHLGEHDSESLDQAMIQIWRCTTDTFESVLGTSSRLAVSVRLDYIKRVYRFERKIEEEERLLRRLLALLRDSGGILSIPRVMLNLAHNLNGQGLHDKAEEMAQEVLSLLREQEIYAKRNVERIECMKIISHSQNNQDNIVGAEQTMRQAIQMIVDEWGPQHSWVLEFKNVLEGWFRDWGQEKDADILRGEIGEFMRKDEPKDVL